MGASCGRFVQAYKHLRAKIYRGSTRFGTRSEELWGKDEKVELRVFAGTWNLGNVEPPADLQDWLKPGCDIYLIGVEECCYTSPPGFSSCFEHWHDLVQSSLPSLLTLCRHDMGHCQILFLATERVSKSIHSVVASHEETGLGGLYSNKGGLALSFWIGDNAICFVSSHLAAHQCNVSRRNLDSAHIIEGICLTTDSQRPLTNQFQHVIWVGDLNYRLDIERKECLELIQNHCWEKLQEYDQLLKVQADGEAFCNFREGPLNFAPTYQHIPGEAVDPETGLRPYDDRKARVPIYIRLSRLTATGLGGGDHHISFRAQYCEEDKHTSNATSKDGKAAFHTVVLTTKRGVCSRKWLQSRHILVAIYKVDDALESAHMRSHPVSTIMALTGLAEDFEEPDGYGVISLTGAAAGAKKFTAPISDSLGVTVGSLHGQVQIMKPPEEEADQILNFKSERTFGGSAHSIKKGFTGWLSPRDTNNDDDESFAPSCCLNVGAKPFDEAAVQRLRFIMLAAVTAAAMNVSQPGCDPPRAAQLSKVLSKMK
eukprot:s2598_g6.t1